MSGSEHTYYLIGFCVLLVVLQIVSTALICARLMIKHLKKMSDLSIMGRIGDLQYAKMLGDSYEKMQEIAIEGFNDQGRKQVNKRMPKERREMIGISRRKWLDKRIRLLEERLNDKTTLENRRNT